MKIATMTWYHYENYGTALQATALTHVLKQWGHDVHMIQYIPFGRHISVLDYSTTSFLKRQFGKKRTSAPHLPAFVSEEKTAKYNRFLNKYLDLTEKCETLSDLESLNDQYDAFVCGSDQIWSPLVFESRYFLDFVHSNEKKIAYAPSLGVKKFEDRFVRDEIKSLLSDFGSLSVREEDGKKLIHDLTGRDAKVVLDPTLLLTGQQWKELCGISDNTSAGRYLLAYFLGNSEEHWESVKATAEALNLELRIIPVHKQDAQKGDCIQEAVGPFEFLELMNHASYVCTDSFHGMNFSLLFHIPFTAYMRFSEDDPRNQNSRVEHLLEMTGMQERLYQNHNEHTLIASTIDYNFCDNELAKRRQDSVSYLKNALETASSAKYKPTHVREHNALCSGCGACKTGCPTNAISIDRNKEGFWSAFVDETKCIHCGKCKQLCPFCFSVQSKEAKKASLYSLAHKDHDILMSSTSGGAAYTISEYLLENGYAVVGCTYDSEAQSAKHVIVRDKANLHLIQGSKYIQSQFAEALSEARNIKTPIAFFGTPCQIAAARRVFGTREDVLYADLVCHGVPSNLLYQKYLDYIHRFAGVCTYNMQMVFRYKPKGWRVIHLFASDGKNEYCCNQFEDPFFRAFEHGICYNETCYDCRWRGNSEADIRLADFWGPRFEDNKTGVSMVICFTPKGKKLVDALSKKDVVIEEQPIDDYLQFQTQSNLPKPVFYRSVMRNLQKNSVKIETIDDRYVFPLEFKQLPRNKHLKYIAKMLLFKD